jgi:hypothetical protein
MGLWPAVFLGAFVVNATTAGSLATSAGIAVGNTLEATFRSEGAHCAAFEEGRFLFHGQPILDLRRNRVRHYELLLRMAGERGELLPGS